MQDSATREQQAFDLLLPLAPATRAIEQRYRTALLGVLTPANRKAIGAAIARSFLAHDPGFRSIVAAVDPLLDPAERVALTAAVVTYLDEMGALYEPVEERLDAVFGVRDRKDEPSNAGAAADPARAATHMVAQLLAPERTEPATLAETKETTLLQNCLPDDAPRLRRMRTSMLEALSPEQHSSVEDAIAHYVTSIVPDRPALIARVGALLSEPQRDQILTAYGTFTFAQKAAFHARIAADKEYSRTLVESPDDADPAALLVQVILMSHLPGSG